MSFHVLRGRGPRVWRVSALSVANGLVQGVTIMLLVPLLGAAGVSIPASGAVSAIQHMITVTFAAIGLEPSLPLVLLAFVVVAWVQAGAERREVVEATRLEQDVEYDLRRSVYAALLDARWSFFAQRRGSDLAHAITRDADRAAAMASHLMRAISQAVSAVIYMAFALAISPVATAAALLGGVGLAAMLRRTVSVAYSTGVEMTDASSETLAVASQHVDAIKLVKSFGAEARTLDAFEVQADRLARAAVKEARAHAGNRAAAAAGAATLLAVLLLAALDWFRLDAAATLVLAFLFWRLLPRLMEVQHSLRDAAHEEAGYDEVQRLLDDARAAREQPVGASTGVSAPPIVLREAVKLRGVGFAYDNRTPVLDRIEASFPAGCITAVTGASGAGKTTLVDLLLGLLRPSFGEILVDAMPLTEAGLAAWRQAVAYVPQDDLLFHDTIRANLRWAQPSASDADLATALRLAGAYEFVQRLPEGLETIVGDRGVRLSGGERQRISLARALVRRPTLLVLDEPTSALDSEGEARVLAALDALRGMLTTVLVTHRSAPLRHADVVYVLADGGLRRQPSGAVYP